MDLIKAEALRLATGGATSNEDAASVVDRAKRYETFLRGKGGGAELGAPDVGMPVGLFAHARDSASEMQGRAIVFRNGGFETVGIEHVIGK